MVEDTTTPVPDAAETTETADEFLNDTAPRVIVEPHPLGGLRFAVWDREQGTYVAQRIDIPEATLLNAHINALLTMAFQTVYIQQAQLAQKTSSGLYVPGR